MHKRPLVASVLRVMVEGLLGTFCPVDSGKKVCSVRNSRYTLLAMVGCGHTH